MAVELHAVAEQVAEVGEELEVVVDLRRTPDLGRVADGGVAGGGERRRVAALGAAAGGVGVAVLHAEVDEPGPAERQAGVAGDRVRAAVARAERAAAQLEAAAGPVVLEQDVHHAGDRVRAVLRRGAVAQDLDLAQRDRRDGREVRPLGALLHAVGVVPGDDRSPVAAFPVDQQQRMVGREAAQMRRADDGGGVAVLLRIHVEGGQDGAQLVGEVGVALPDEVGGGDGVDRRRRIGDRPRPRPGPTTTTSSTNGGGSAASAGSAGGCGLSGGVRWAARTAEASAAAKRGGCGLSGGVRWVCSRIGRVPPPSWQPAVEPRVAPRAAGRPPDKT